MFVAKKQSESEHVHSPQHSSFHRYWHPLKNRLEMVLAATMSQSGKNTCGQFAGWLPGLSVQQINQLRPDIVHLHWINYSSISLPEIQKLDAPIVWTMHDLWPISAGYNYLGSIQKGSPEEADYRSSLYGRTNLRLKRNLFASKNIALIAPSRWIASEAVESQLVPPSKIHHIPNGIDLNIFSVDRRFRNRSRFGIPDGKKVILTGAVGLDRDPRKGFDLLLESLKFLEKSLPEDKQPVIVVFGNRGPIPDLGLRFPVIPLGNISSEDELATLYNSCDLFALPSREDNLPNVVAESLACGLPCVGFRIGGVPDMIDHRRNGYLAEPFDIQDFAQGIAETLLGEGWSISARKTAEQKFDSISHANRLLELYKCILPSFAANSSSPRLAA